MTSQPTTSQRTATDTPAAAFVAYEYAAVRPPRDLEALYQDTYRSFGWTVDSTETPAAAAGSTRRTLTLKRDRGIRNRQLVQTLQRKAEGSLGAIEQLEKSKTSRALATAVTIGIIGAAFLAGSVFTLEGGFLVVSILLGAVGLLAWVAGYLAYLGVKSRRTTAVVPLIDREFDALYEASEQATRLLQY